MSDVLIVVARLAFVVAVASVVSRVLGVILGR